MAGSTHTATMKRIQREIRDVQQEDLGEIKLQPWESNMFRWKASIPGPEGSIYEGGVFDLDINLPRDYPFTAPNVVFTTRIYHMNVSAAGNICLDVLKGAWSPALSLFKVMLSISSLLTDPNPKDPLVPPIAQQYTRNRQLHDSTAREWTKLYAAPPAPPLPKKPVAKPKSAAPSAQSSRRGTPSNTTTRGKSKKEREVIEISSDNEGAEDQPIEIESDGEGDTVPDRPVPVQTGRKGKGKGKATSRVQRAVASGSEASSVSVAGSKRIRGDDNDVDDEGDAVMSTPSAGDTRQTSNGRPSKRRGGPSV